MNVIDIYRAHYEEVCSWHEDEYDKYEWAANYIFDLCTYDAELDEKFVKAILEICQVIIDKENFYYIYNDKNYTTYILVCQLLNNFQWIDWGTSIRGAWFENYRDGRKVILEDIGKIDGVPFSIDNLKALIEFMKEE